MSRSRLWTSSPQRMTTSDRYNYTSSSRSQSPNSIPASGYMDYGDLNYTRMSSSRLKKSGFVFCNFCLVFRATCAP